MAFMMNQKFVGEAWEDYRRHFIPTDAPPRHVAEIWHAFYAGAQSVIYILSKILESGSEPTAADLEVMKSVLHELQTFTIHQVHESAND